MNATRAFANSAEAVGDARRFVTGALTGVPRDVSDEIAIMVSELATNCVRHTETDFSIQVDQTEREIRVEVTDRGTGLPAVRSPEPDELSGRGLRIVLELSDSFGFREVPGAPGKTVWFVVELKPEGSRAEAR